jgi:hypothetical protein
VSEGFSVTLRRRRPGATGRSVEGTVQTSSVLEFGLQRRKSREAREESGPRTGVVAEV